MGRFKNFNLILMVSLSLFIPLFLAYSLYVEWSGSTLLSSDMGYEDPGDEDLLICQKEFGVVPTAYLVILDPETEFARESYVLSYLLTPRLHCTSILRC
jgi:hypothetical protein